jgi:hypothetical protein
LKEYPVSKTLRKSLDKASFRYEDVTVTLDGELGVERDALYKELKETANAPQATLGMGPILAVQARIDALEDRMREDLVTFRFWALGFEKWNQLIAQHPPREGVPLDERKGYDIVQVTKATAEATGFVMDGEDAETVAADEWKDLWANLTGGDFDRIYVVVTRLNETNGWMGVDHLKKGSSKTPASTGTSVSPEPSE